MFPIWFSTCFIIGGNSRSTHYLPIILAPAATSPRCFTFIGPSTLSHIILGILALRTWWSETKSRLSRFSTFPRLLQYFLPRLLLGLILYIPGTYLEWPSDPWEHLRRINEWHVCQMVGDHSTWIKSSYFLAYSLLGRAFSLRQLFWLDFYYTGICLLLCWQYYRLATQAVRTRRTSHSLVFVILQALLFGVNDIFSFYRYYGISSSVYAQLGAVALTRLGI